MTMAGWPRAFRTSSLLLSPLDMIVVLAVTFGVADLVLAREFALLEPANELLVQFVDIARILVVVSAAAWGVWLVLWIDGAVCCVAQSLMPQRRQQRVAAIPAPRDAVALGEAGVALPRASGCRDGASPAGRCGTSGPASQRIAGCSRRSRAAAAACRAPRPTRGCGVLLCIVVSAVPTRAIRYQQRVGPPSRLTCGGLGDQLLR